VSQLPGADYDRGADARIIGGFAACVSSLHVDISIRFDDGRPTGGLSHVWRTGDDSRASVRIGSHDPTERGFAIELSPLRRIVSSRRIAGRATGRLSHMRWPGDDSRSHRWAATAKITDSAAANQRTTGVRASCIVDPRQ